MVNNIPSLKAKPEMIPFILGCIKDHSGDFSEMETCTANIWREHSLRISKPTIRNSLRAVFGPTLRHLKLVRGEGDDLVLMPAGKSTLESFLVNGELGFKQTFAKHFVRLDREEGVDLFSRLSKLSDSGNFLTVSEFLQNLQTSMPTSTITNDRLRKFLYYGKYFGLLDLKQGKIVFNNSHFKNLVAGTTTILSDEHFVKILINEYFKMVGDNTTNPYVGLPTLRDSVDETTGISPFYFDEKLKVLQKETSQYLIHLTEPMQRMPGGIWINGRYLYYISIYDKNKEPL
jgi:hypothetical protein